MREQKRRLLKSGQVCDKVGVGKSTIYELIRFGNPKFPAPVKKLGKNSRWVKSEVDAWIEKRITQHREAG